MKNLLPGMPACPLKSVRLIGSDGKKVARCVLSGIIGEKQ